jgi:hypothetical protein
MGKEDNCGAPSKRGLAGAGGALTAFYSAAAACGFTVTGVAAGSAAAASQSALGGFIAVGSTFWFVQASTGLLCAGYSTTVAGAVLPIFVPVALAAGGYKLARSKL